MPVLRCKYPGGYAGSRPGLREVWPVGAEREISAEDADYLTSTFPAYFDRMALPGTARTLAPVEALDGPVRALAPAVEAGAYDDCIAALIAAERAGAARKTLLRALKARARHLADLAGGD
jgi:hypothetical protein